MAKIILSVGDEVLRELTLPNGRITIGRRPHNDVVIDHRAISGEHAAIETAGGDSFLEDLNSTNGTQVNGQPVKKHFLQDRDAVDLAQFRLTYIAGGAVNAADKATAKIRVMTGACAGKEVLLDKVLTTLGRPGLQVAAVTRKGQSYFLAHIEGDGPPILNGREVGAEPLTIADGDLIEFAGAQMQIVFPA